MKKGENYYLGLDIGTNSIGYCVTNESYVPLKLKDEPIMGVHLFEEASLAQTRRGFRSNRRRLDRRQERVRLLQQIFAQEIAKVDNRFFIRIKESGLTRKDVSNLGDSNIYFNTPSYSDKDYYRDYPTIHHLIDDLMFTDEKKDIRLVYIACVWLVAHRGHFLRDIDKQNVSEVKNFNPLYEELKNYFIDQDIPAWDFNNEKEFSEIIKKQIGVKDKTKAFNKLLFNGKKASEDRLNCIITLLSGGKVSLVKLFNNDVYTDEKSISLKMKEEEYLELFTLVQDEESQLLKILKAIYDWVF